MNRTAEHPRSRRPGRSTPSALRPDRSPRSADGHPRGAVPRGDDEPGRLRHNRSGRPRGYLQRLAVHPDERRRGLGRSLVLDSLTWLRRRGATVVLVNTQEDNHAALALVLEKESLGFERRAEELAVL
ncbi:MAG: GNAT family N-acetyltransferase [Acidimicrobiia bacterium]|nr:GNAT family N-acetyltransferase [Acidimicrobiia bacterium]